MKKADGHAFERRIAKQGGGRKVPGSGNREMKQDVYEDKWLIQCKSTNKRSLSIKLDDLLGLKIDAMMRGRLPRFEFELYDGAETHQFVVLSKKIFEQGKDFFE